MAGEWSGQPRSDYERARDHDLLIALNQKVDLMTDQIGNFVEKAEGETGFGRCQVHSSQIKDMQSSIKWTRRTVIGAALAFVGKMLYGFVGIPR